MENPPQNLQSIIDGCLKNDRKAQRALYEMFAGKMLVVCMRYCGDKQTAQDWMHDGFISIYSNIKQYQNKGAFEGWMRKIMVNVSLDHLRRNRLVFDDNEEAMFAVYDDSQPNQIEQLSAKEILQMITRLPANQRTVFNLHAIEGYSLVEIAHKLNINEATVRSHYARARQTLRTMIEKG
ncbi:MAG: RNA polymerase sigma factor [Bacteroidales bacterium]|nr:RNA polymerase sigma factor [Bacteroidales bacterium]